MRNFEITVKVNCSLKELNDYLIEKNFKIMEKYDCYDRYMINKDIDISNMKDLDILSKCVLLRELVGIKSSITYKNKVYDENENIIKQSKIDCIIYDLEEGRKLLEAMNYKILFEIYDKLTVYSDGNIELSVQYVNDKYLFIEVEDTSSYTPNHNYENIDDMINDFKKIGIDCEDNYFVKKAQIILNEEVLCS